MLSADFKERGESRLTALSTQIHPRQPRNHSYGSMSRLWEDQGRCISWGDTGHCGEVEVDDKAWGKVAKAGEKTYELPHDVQVQRGEMGALRSHRRLRQLEVCLAS